MTIERISVRGIGFKGKLQVVEMDPTNERTSHWEQVDSDGHSHSGTTITAITSEALAVEDWVITDLLGYHVTHRRILIQNDINQAKLEYGWSLVGKKHRILWRPSRD